MDSKSDHNPYTYQRLKHQYPDYFDAMDALGAAVRHAGPLDEKTVQLIQLSAAAAIRSEGAVHSHTRRALAAGATTEQIHHTLLALTSTIGFPTVIAAMSWVDDVIGKGGNAVPDSGLPD
ncbi:carboxymuconolactone decarboxylase family protein [Pseudomonas sp. 6D_7.1_Bac1]|jgi:4-carboxymuconolactone decarboxylase|uniref:carboxymuconolactone decarboxylase family protein n=1 Tax=Pseudomonas sp. 6D_7.1_Bac1 TaxID=2971615 RepID=UPI0021C76C37|nr:carboxymuconolactone decarboxylase family protein [Pseudomonas sp. 6D_7.1_Bac1]MCU1748051.1 carboxymuconolactone decarboxylase family protein [Pseudomonas sp. 6D_7.1_Bac1]